MKRLLTNGAGAVCVLSAIVLAVAPKAANVAQTGANGDPSRNPTTATHRIRESHFESGERTRTFGSMAEEMKAARLEMPVVHVDGQVRITGPVRWHLGMNLNQAIDEAGGPTEFGQVRRVEVVRSGSGVVRTFDLTDPDLATLPIAAGDKVTVPECAIFGQ